MADRVVAFVKRIQDAPGILPKDLADQIGVSVRTLRKYVRYANERMKGCACIRLVRASGYILEVIDGEAYRDWTNQSDGDASPMPQTPDERVLYIMNNLLVRTDWVRLEDLASDLFVSRTVISTDLKSVKRRLIAFGLMLESRPHYGIRVTGDEMSRRLCLANVVLEMTDDADREEGVAGMVGFGTREEMRVIADCVQDGLNSGGGYRLNPCSYQNLLIHIAIAIVRVRDGCGSPLREEQCGKLCESGAFAVASRIADLIRERLGVELSFEETSYIAIHLAGKQSLQVEGPDDGNVVICDDVWDAVGEMLEVVWRAFRYDFRDDLELRMNLARHIVPLSVRLKYNMAFKNPLLADIRERFPLAFSMAGDACTVLTERYRALLSDDERGYIALAFALALERKKYARPKKNLLIVCGSGTGSARMLEWQCRREFGDYIDRISVRDTLTLCDEDFTGIDYVFTTVPIERPVPVPVREVRHFFDEDEAGGIRRLLDTDVDGASGSLSSCFASDLFFPHITARNKAEVIDFLVERVSAVRLVSDDFSELVWRREDGMPTSYGNRTAIPHPIEAASDETFACMGLLDEPVIWDEAGNEVSVVVLFSFSRRSDEGLQGIFGGLAELLMSCEAIDRLLDDRGWDTLRELLSTCESGE